MGVARFGSPLPRRERGRGARPPADTNAFCVGVVDRLDLGAGCDEKSTLQQVIGVAEVDEFLALFVDGKKSHIPAVGGRRILDLARSLMREDLQRHAKFCGERAAEGDSDTTIGITVLNGELRGW